MEDSKKLKLFISYSHLDEKSYVDQFRKHIATLKDNDLIEDWYDRKILAGDGYQNKIDNNLNDADIICLFISANFLSSENCKKEKKKALELRKNKWIVVVPIILSHCGWLDDKDLSKLLALPTDGEPITSFQDQSEAWNVVYNGLKKIIKKELKIRQIKISKGCENFLQDTEMLAKAHSNKERVLLDDIFIYSELNKYDDLKEYKETIQSEDLIKSLLDYKNIVIAGGEQSGKTTLCRMIFKSLLKKNFIPIYVSDKNTNFSGKMENRIVHSFKEQYSGLEIHEIDRERIIPIIDDFHFARDKEKHIRYLLSYSSCIVVVDDIFSLNIKDERLIGSFSNFKIKELKPSLRYELIKKWVSLSDKIGTIKAENTLYHDIDNTSELIDSILGKTIGRGIMPSYPFFILSTIVTYETFAMPLDQEITSQGYCYQAFAYFYLKKQGVRNDEIDIYINFLSEIAFYFYKKQKYELSPKEFSSFMRTYLEKYNLPVKQDTLLKNLRGIVLNDNFNNYSFKYPYLYYFFVAKYLAEHLEDGGVSKLIEKVLNNLHVNENAYIAVFVAHHSKNVKILEEIELNALCLFDKYSPATLTKDEVKFFDEQADIIIKAVLPSNKEAPEKVRTEKLKIRDKIEESHENAKEEEDDINNKNFLAVELRRSIKTVEVMGNIIKNRAGSLEKTKLEEIYKEAMNVHLRILTSFFEVIKNEEKVIIDYISKRLTKLIEGKKRSPSLEKMEDISRIIFWNLNFYVVYGILDKIVHSLGSDKLIEIIEKVCDEINTPASFIARQGILMWYNKNIEINEIEEKLKMKDFSEIAKKVLKKMVVNHYSLHSFNYKDRQRIEKKLGISAKQLLAKGYKKS